MYERASKQSLDPKSSIALGLRLGSKIPGSATVNNSQNVEELYNVRDIISVLIVNKICLSEYSF